MCAKQKADLLPAGQASALSIDSLCEARRLGALQLRSQGTIVRDSMSSMSYEMMLLAAGREPWPTHHHEDLE